MNTLTLSCWLPSLGLVTILLVSQRVSAQPAVATHGAFSEQLSNDLIYRAWGANSVVRQCGLCHYSPGNEFATRNSDFCDLSEVKTWLENDKHAISRQRIEPLDQTEIEQYRRTGSGTWVGQSNYVSLRMCQSLGYDVKTETGYAQFRDNCLTCHAGYEPHTSATDFTRAAPNRPGIACTYCHQIGDRVDWIDRHSSSSTERSWRLLTPPAKAAAGMRDLIGARAQGDMCGSCHIGDHRRGMFVTHAMYVAGHPPLPNFELQKFVSSMPPHWRDMKQTYEKLAAFPDRDAYFAQNVELGKADSRNLEATFWETRTMLLGALAAAEHAAALSAEADTHWGDYALYDCSACHHELRISSSRQKGRNEQIPGRPRLLEWPTPLLSVALSIAESPTRVRDAGIELSNVINATPFGDPSLCIPAALRLQTALQQTSETLATKPIQLLQARQVLHELANTAPDQLVNYHSARQVVWGIQLVDRELFSMRHPLNESARNLINALGQQAQHSFLSTELPSRISGSLYDVSEEHADGAQVSYLAAELERLRRYDPEIILSQLRELRAELE